MLSQKQGAEFGYNSNGNQENWPTEGTACCGADGNDINKLPASVGRSNEADAATDRDREHDVSHSLPVQRGKAIARIAPTLNPEAPAWPCHSRHSRRRPGRDQREPPISPPAGSDLHPWSQSGRRRFGDLPGGLHWRSSLIGIDGG
jgi:hypothetical protein